MTAASKSQQSQHFAVADTYDPDEVVPRDSPLMTPMRPRLEPSPSPTLDIHPAHIRPTSGDAVLVAYLDNSRNPEIAQIAGSEVLPGEEDSLDDESSVDGRPDEGAVIVPTLQQVAGYALQLQTTTPSGSRAPARKITTDISDSTRQLSLRDDLSHSNRPLPSGTSIFPNAHHAVQPHTTTLLSVTAAGLPPLMDSPRADLHGQMLPSLRSTFGDLNNLPTDPLAHTDKDLGRHAHSSAFPVSPVPRFPIAASHGSPPISPNEMCTRNLPSPHSLPASSPRHFKSNGIAQHHSIDCSSSSTAGETPSTDQSASTPATSSSVADRMSLEVMTNPTVGGYVCSVAGCNAQPFQTQYLLNSHANVHSSARPHYCPVAGCLRSQSGKGFKRKNEMIRHRLVHESPGYVCPFCPDREHKYPRPDNLQRHVRVHHPDKNKDDILLREVLSQRPDGPNRGRRRRGPPS